MEISCKELFDMFKKSTGKLVCSYIDKKCIFEQNSINLAQCNIQPENSDELDTLYLNFSKKNNQQYLHKYYDYNTKKYYAEKIHLHQTDYTKSFVIGYDNELDTIQDLKLISSSNL